MSKKIARVVFTLYHGLFASVNATCRFRPTCSQYAVEAVEKRGILEGSRLALKRVLSCHPFSKRPVYDPTP